MADLSMERYRINVKVRKENRVADCNQEAGVGDMELRRLLRMGGVTGRDFFTFLWATRRNPWMTFWRGPY